MSAPMLMSRPRPSRQVNPFSRYMRKSQCHVAESKSVATATIGAATA